MPRQLVLSPFRVFTRAVVGWWLGWLAIGGILVISLVTTTQPGQSVTRLITVVIALAAAVLVLLWCLNQPRRAAQVAPQISADDQSLRICPSKAGTKNESSDQPSTVLRSEIRYVVGLGRRPSKKCRIGFADAEGEMLDVWVLPTVVFPWVLDFVETEGYKVEMLRGRRGLSIASGIGLLDLPD